MPSSATSGSAVRGQHRSSLCLLHLKNSLLLRWLRIYLFLFIYFFMYIFFITAQRTTLTEITILTMFKLLTKLIALFTVLGAILE